MKSLNRIEIIGYVGRTPDLRYTAEGSPRVQMNVATDESWKDKRTGDLVEETQWHRVVLRDRLAEIVGEHVIKGSQVFVSGKLRTREYQDKDGATRLAVEILANDLILLGGKRKGEESGEAGATARTGTRPAPTSQFHDPFGEPPAHGAGRPPENEVVE